MTKRYLIVCQAEHGGHEHVDADTLREAAGVADSCFHRECDCEPVIYEKVPPSMVAYHHPQTARPEPGLP